MNVHPCLTGTWERKMMVSFLLPMLIQFPFALYAFNQRQSETPLSGKKSYLDLDFSLIFFCLGRFMIFHNNVDLCPSTLFLIFGCCWSLYYQFHSWTTFGLSNWHYISGPVYVSSAWGFFSAAVCVYLDSIFSEKKKKTHRLPLRTLKIWWHQCWLMRWSYKIVTSFQNISFLFPEITGCMIT